MKRKDTLAYVTKKLPYVFRLKEDGGMISGRESSGGKDDSNSRPLFQQSKNWPHFNFHYSFRIPSILPLMCAIHFHLKN